MSKLRYILAKAIDLESLYDKMPGLFQTDRLNVEDRVKLVDFDMKKYKHLLDVTTLKPNEKLHVLLQLRKCALTESITFTDIELESLESDNYYELVSLDFTKYIRKHLWNKFKKDQKIDLFFAEPLWVFENTDTPPKLSADRLTTLALSKPKFINEYITDFSQYSTTEAFWNAMIAFDRKYKEIFIRNTKTCLTKTDVRSVIYRHKDLVKLIDADVLENSKLSCKEWIILISGIMGSNTKMFDDWEFSPEVAEIFKMDLMAEMLNGKSKTSMRFQNALKTVFSVRETEVENENKDLV